MPVALAGGSSYGIRVLRSMGNTTTSLAWMRSANIPGSRGSTRVASASSARISVPPFGPSDATVLGGIVFSRAFGQQDVHASLGVELNADDLERTRARYAIGAS